ncbi:hypothetical protein AX769_02595 [Frondihabitans sp. PAMC 28766]|uniref:hypothetical protein n=1 Tax=Frondihabitans sp. PAMC 28766 TaxID=1795630 RepID=UPI00078CF0B2|nr:hypothetical protein [Frondihabitans sp. PAMC 28766]AMM19224.1 hypothetical protein AX769_02595 [Frondihabitans sp. PAMC 28766]
MSATETPSRPSRPDAPVVAAVPETRAYRRILRRETHSSRSGAAVIVLIALVIVSAWVGIESVYAGLGLKALLFSPLDSLATLVTASTHQGGLVIAVGIVTGIVGLILVIVGITAGRRGRHTIDDPRVAVVVDDQVVAASLARRARLAGSLAPGQVNAWVSRNSARITITPASGAGADNESVLAAARAELDEGRYTPAITPHVRVSDAGRLGA